MNAGELIRQLRERLEEAWPEAADYEAMLLAEFVTGESFSRLKSRPELPVTEEQRDRAMALAEQRAGGEPLQYLLGSWEFFGMEFAVGPGVLVPRPDTEIIVETALELMKPVEAPRIIDLCSGSGAIALALWKHLKGAKVWAAELSEEALPWLRKNVSAHCAGAPCPVEILAADVLGPIPVENLDLVVSNPPYIPRYELPGLAADVQREPKMALDGGEDGLDFYRALTRLYRPALKPGGWLVYEVGYDQADAVEAILRENGYENASSVLDYGGIRRCVKGRKPL